MAVMTDGPGTRAPARQAAGQAAGAAVRLAGALLSLALVAGVGVWGYRLFVRDMTGVPVVRAMAGPMREAPGNPGGQIAANTGLAVNAVAALGEAAPPEDVLMLAPAAAGLAPEDMEVQSMAEAGEVMAAMPGMDAQDAGLVQVAAEGAAPLVQPAISETPMTPAEVLALADMIASGGAPAQAGGEVGELPGQVVGTEQVSEVNAAVAEALAAAVSVQDAGGFPIAADVPGVRVTYRPPARPGTVRAEPVASPVPAPAAETEATLIADAVPAGTVLVQLGAYEAAAIAAADWETLSARFAEFMGGKVRVIQPAETGGEAFFRLRAAGFGDMEDAGRFCAVLIAEGARCVPVVAE